MLPSSVPVFGTRDLRKDLQDGARSALDAAATRVADTASQAESALSSAAATLQEIDEKMPRNCTLGTKRICVGYKQDINCSKLPLTLSSVLHNSTQELSRPAKDAIRGRVNDALSQLAKGSGRFPAPYIPATLLSGLLLMTAIAALSLSLALGRPPYFTVILRALTSKTSWQSLMALALGLACCSPFILLGVTLNAMLKATDELPPWVRVERGEACGLGFAALACALTLVLKFATVPMVVSLYAKRSR